MNQSLSPAELEQRFAEINAREPEELTAEEAAALVRGRDYVLPEDVSLVFGDVVPHRLLLSPRAEADRSFDPVSELLERVPAPRIS